MKQLTSLTPCSLAAPRSSILTNWIPCLSQSSSIFSNSSITWRESSSSLPSKSNRKKFSNSCQTISNSSLTEDNNQVVNVLNQRAQRFRRHLFNHILVIAGWFVLDEPLKDVFLSWQFICREHERHKIIFELDHSERKLMNETNMRNEANKMFLARLHNSFSWHSAVYILS